MVTKNLKKILIYILGVFVCLTIISLFYLKKVEKNYQNKIFPNVYIDKIDFSGKTKTEVIDFYKNKSKELQSLNFILKIDSNYFATFSGKQLNLHYDGETVSEQAYLIGRSPLFLSAFSQKILSLTKTKDFNFFSQIKYDDQIIKEKLNVLKDFYDKPAKNALFEFKNNKVINFRKEEIGRKINIEETLKEINKKINSLKTNKKDQIIKIKVEIIKPEITLSTINNFGIEELIAQGKSDFSHSAENRVHNIILAASKFHGVLIPPNKILSFNQTVGDISTLSGYKQAYIIKEGKTILGDGGGVCQVSTTLFRAALNAGLEIVERQSHAYRVLYYENDMKPGFDATVFSPVVDLKIKNNTPAYILIQTKIDKENNLLYFYFYGKKDNRKVEISPVEIWDISPPLEAKYQDDPTLKKGVVKQIEYPAWGAKTKFDYKVYKDNQLIINKKIFSFYQPWPAVYLVGTAD